MKMKREENETKKKQQLKCVVIYYIVRSVCNIRFLPLDSELANNV